MSMLSAQCDKLRELATRFDEIQSGATRVVRVSLDSGSVLRDAAHEESIQQALMGEGGVPATDELRQMLDERGVEWSATVGASGTIWTHYDAFNGHRIHAMDNEDGTVEIFGEWDVTPAQAIAATLGRGTCHMETADGCQNWNSCSECDADYYTDQPINYCPNCGRKVVDR